MAVDYGNIEEFYNPEEDEELDDYDLDSDFLDCGCCYCCGCSCDILDDYWDDYEYDYDDREDED